MPPQAIFIVDTKKEEIAVAEANRLGIPVFGLIDTNSDPDLVQYPIPGNDDAVKSIKFIAGLMVDSVIEGRKEFLEGKKVQQALPGPGSDSMMATTTDDIKRLREETSCGVIDCKKALEEAKGNFNKAKELLRKRGLEMAAKNSHRTAKEGRVEGYIHNGNKIGVVVEVNCETDFVARSEDFCKFTRDVAIHIAALNPKYIKKEDVPADVLAREADKEAYIKANCLLAQAYVKDPSKNVQDLLNELVAKIGENIVVGRSCPLQSRRVKYSLSFRRKPESLKDPDFRRDDIYKIGK